MIRVWGLAILGVAGGAGIALSACPTIVATVLAMIVVLLFMGWLVHALARRSGMAAVLIAATFLLNRPVGNVTGIESVSRALSVADDAVLLLGLLMLLHAPPVGDRVVPRMFWIGFAIFAVLGVGGGLLDDAPLRSVVAGSWLALKLPIATWIMLRLRWTRRDVRALQMMLATVLVVTVAVSMVELLRPDAVRSVFGYTPGQTDRLSLTSLKGIFAHPVQSATFMLFTASVFVGATRGRTQVVGLVALAMAVLSLRVKALVDVVAIIGMRLVMSARASTRYLSPLLLVCLLGAVATAGYDLIRLRIGAILGDGDFARSRLLEASWAIARDHFPVGTGFGTFGSEASLHPYSDVYVQYGLSDSYGFRPEAPLFATDASWATVMGEAGALGAVLVVVALGALWVSLFRRARDGKGQGFRLAALVFVSVVLIDSLASPRLFDGFAAVGLGALISLAAQPPDDEAEPTGPAPEVARAGRS